MRISIIIASHNEGDSLWKTIRTCVEAEPGLDYELVVADDASSDGSVAEAQQRFPRLRVARHERRLGTSPAKDLGAGQARGDVLIFLDGHTNPAPGAIRRLAEGVELLQGRAIVTPTVAGLDERRWRNTPSQVGHGYFLDLERFHCGWLPLSELRPVQEGSRRFYESPALIGCALAMSRELYEDLQGFDPRMRSWGAEDLDLGLKCWLMGYRILHDPEAVVGHRFRREFESFAVPPEHFVANQLRMARKNFGHGAWSDWVDRCRQRNSGRLVEHPEGLWARAWQLFEEDRLSVEQERSYLMARRVRDEFWYAERFGLSWPRLQSARVSVPAGPQEGGRASAASISQLSPSPSPPPPAPEPPPTPPCEEGECCDCGCSEAPVRYSNGEVQITVTELEAPGFGKAWGQKRSYSNQLSFDGDMGNGYNWLVEQWPYLVAGGDGSIAVAWSPRKALWFDPAGGGGYTARYGAKSTLEHDAANSRFVVKSPAGEQWRFHDFDQADNPAGLFQAHATPGGQLTEVASYTADGRIGEVRRAATTGGVTTTESFLYAYTEEGRAESVTLRRQVGGGAWDEIRRVAYEYYGASEDHGEEGDLKRAAVQVPAGPGWADAEVRAYRYYKAGESRGFAHGLKYALGPAAYARMVADGLDPLTAGDGQVALYADYYFEYDGDRRVTKEAVEAGSRTFTFAYTASGNADGPNNWKIRTVETRPGGSQHIVYTNAIGQILLKELRSGSQGWIDNYQFDAANRQVLHAKPSAVIGYNDAVADLGVSLRAGAGLIELKEYYATSGGGGAAGYLQHEKIKRGSGGAPVLLKSYEYASRTGGGATIYPISKQTTYRNDDGTGAISTSYGYTWQGSTVLVQELTETLPAVPASQNGSGLPATTRAYYDAFGNQTWQMDERGFITRWSCDIATAAVVRRVDDVDTSLIGDEPSGWVTPSGGGLNLVTDFENDALGRQIQELGPWHTIDLNGVATSVRRASWVVYKDAAHEAWVGNGYASGSAPSYTYTLINPVTIEKRDAGGKMLEAIEARRASASGRLQPTDSFPQSSYTRWSTYQYTDCCLAASLRVYRAIPASGTGSPGTNYDQTTYGYDLLKRRNRTVTPGGTITFEVFDVREQVIGTYVGTNDAGATESDPTGGGATGNNMVIVTGREYDGGQAGGDGNLTKETQHVDATTARVTAYLYDWRNRRTGIDGEVDFYQKDFYDNLDHVVRTDRHDTTENGNLIDRYETLFDNRRRVYRTIRYGVDPATGTVGNSLKDDTWYDDATNILKKLPAGANIFIKFTYDGIGREIIKYVGYDIGEVDYVEVGSVTDDVILEQSETIYDTASNILYTISRQRYHNAPASQLGQLGDPSSTPKARVTYQAQWVDPLGRVLATAEYGTNGGSALNRPSTIPSRSDNVLVTSTIYDSAGNRQSVTDPAGIVTNFEHDDIGRQITIVDNYKSVAYLYDADPGSVPSEECTLSDDMNRTVLIEYTPDGERALLVVRNSRTLNQTTTYTYGTTLANSEVATSTLLRSITYPDSSGSSDIVTFAYNRQGQRIVLGDQSGSAHLYDYDKLGRLIYDRVATLGAGVDGTVRRLGVTYEVRGMPDKLTSYDNAVVGSGSVVNQVQQLYNSFSQPILSAQAHADVVSNTSPVVNLSYADGSANTIRPTGIVYPNGRVLTYSYGNSGGNSSHASRIAALVDDNMGATHLANYEFLGLRTVVVADHTEPEVKYMMVDLLGNNDPDTGDIYTGIDRFGRVKDCLWYNYNASSDVVRIQYGYSRVSNRIWRSDIVAQAAGKYYDELYSYDGLRRLQTMQRGLLNGSHTEINNQTFGQCWNLDATGNWTEMKEADGGSTWTLQQSRTANPVNEINGITNTVGTAWAQPTYDAAGNITTIPQMGSPSNSYECTYDAWNRLVKLVDPATSDIVQENQYDVRMFRIVRLDYFQGNPTEIRHFYYTPDWRCIEERVGTADSPDRQYVWGLQNVDTLVLRDRDTTGDGTLDERLYACQDANLNTVAQIGTDGTVRERYSYNQYGVPLFMSGSFVVRPASDFDCETLYCGYRFDKTTCIYLVRFRFYVPGLGVWGQRDPIEFAAGLSFYEYCRSQPAVMVDPSGLKWYNCLEISRTPVALTRVAKNWNVGIWFFQVEIWGSGTMSHVTCDRCCSDGSRVVDTAMSLTLSVAGSIAGGIGRGLDFELKPYGRLFGYVGAKLSGSVSANLSVGGSTDKCAGINSRNFKGCVDIAGVGRLSGGGSAWVAFGWWNYDFAFEVFGQISGTFAQLCYNCTVPGGCQLTVQNWFEGSISKTAGFRFCLATCYTWSL